MLKFSIVIPLYNKKLYIKRAVDSVLAQTIKNFELIIVDDGSTDNSVNIVKNIHDERIRLVQQENEGECAARNTGIRAATYNYIAFLDADDEWKPDFLSTISELIDLYPNAGAYGTGIEIVSVDKRIKIKNILSHGPHGLIENYFKVTTSESSPLTSSSVCIPKSTFEKVGKFPVGVKRNGDTCTWINIALKYPIAFSSKICAKYYRDVEDSACNKYLPQQIPFEKTILDAIKNGEIKDDTVIYAKELLAKLNYIYATRYLVANKIPEARQWAKRAKTKNFKLRLKIFAVLFLSLLPYGIIKYVGLKFGNIKAEFNNEN